MNVAGAGDGAIASADVPAALSGKAMVNQLAGTGGQPVTYRGNAYAALGTLAPAATATAATLFFEFATTRLAGTKLHLGLSADASPGLGLDTTGDALDLADFGPQITVDPRGLVARDGGTDRVLGGLRLVDNTVYRVWLVVNNAADTFRVYAAAPGAAATRLSSGSTYSFAFRTRSSAPLRDVPAPQRPDRGPVGGLLPGLDLRGAVGGTQPSTRRRPSPRPCPSAPRPPAVSTGRTAGRPPAG